VIVLSRLLGLAPVVHAVQFVIDGVRVPIAGQ
jgi:small neutral amino acid transporter SnatA (MarC family)